jgi:FlaA1/EpsC-like NDP-sugar epimerase
MGTTVSIINHRLRRVGRAAIGVGRRRRRMLQLLWLLLDAAVIFTVMQASMRLLDIGMSASAVGILALIVGVRLVSFVRLGMYRSVLRYSGIHTLMTTCLGVVLGTSIGVAAAFFLGFENTAGLGRAFLVMEALMAIMLCGGARLSVRMALERVGRSEGKRVVVYGTGDLGEMAMRDLIRVKGYTPVGFLDDDPANHHGLIHGKPVLGGRDRLVQLAKEHHIEVVVLAINNASSEFVRELFQSCMAVRVHLVVAQSIADVRRSGNHLDLRELAFEDLLPRPSRSLDPAPVRRMLDGRCVMVTGAGGSIGSELCRQIAAGKVSRLILLDHSEFNLYSIHLELTDRFPGLPLTPVLCNLQCRATLDQILSCHRPTVVFHAAAYKHVPLVEENPFLATLNNVGSFRTLIAACDDAGVERLVQISTDKAVRPTNVMGATKRACELLLQNYPVRNLHLCAVRFGNVLGSSGSVVPRFLAQIASGGPVTVTHPDITRYFMLIPEAAALVLQAGALADHGEIFILDMGAPVKISDLARQLIFMSGHDPDADMRIQYSGLRPGEKLYEELLLEDRESSTIVQGILKAKATKRPWEEIQVALHVLFAACGDRDQVSFVRALKQLVPEWVPSAAYSEFVSVAGSAPAAVEMCKLPSKELT